MNMTERPREDCVTIKDVQSALQQQQQPAPARGLAEGASIDFCRNEGMIKSLIYVV